MWTPGTRVQAGPGESPHARQVEGTCSQNPWVSAVRAGSSGEHGRGLRFPAGQPGPPPAAPAAGAGPGGVGHDRQPGLQGTQDGNRVGRAPSRCLLRGLWGGVWGGGEEDGPRGRAGAGQLSGLCPRRWSWSPGSCPRSCPSWWTTTPSTWIRNSQARRRPRSRTRARCQRVSPSTGCGRWAGGPPPRAPPGLTVLGRRFLQEQRMACEVGLYYVLHITKQRNKNALLRLLPGLGESRGRRAQLCPLTDALGSRHPPRLRRVTLIFS